MQPSRAVYRSTSAKIVHFQLYSTRFQVSRLETRVQAPAFRTPVLHFRMPQLCTPGPDAHALVRVARGWFCHIVFQQCAVVGVVCVGPCTATLSVGLCAIFSFGRNCGPTRDFLLLTCALNQQCVLSHFVAAVSTPTRDLQALRQVNYEVRVRATRVAVSFRGPFQRSTCCAGVLNGLPHGCSLCRLALVQLCLVVSFHQGACVDTLVCGGDSSCTITNGLVSCVGGNTNGELGIGSTEDSAAAVTPTGLGVVTSLVIGSSHGHVCAITAATKQLLCWGNNSHGQLGVGTTVAQHSPVVVPGFLGAGVLAVGLGPFHTCAATTTGVTKCWGMNANGQLGNGNQLSSLLPVTVPVQGAVSFAATATATCALLSNSTVACWGQVQGRLTLTPVPLLHASGAVVRDVAVIASGYGHTCLLMSAGDEPVYCYGENGSGQLGISSIEPQSFPTPVATLTQVAVLQIALGERYTCVLFITRSARCFGSGKSGQLGDSVIGLDPGSWAPAWAVTGLFNIAMVSAGREHGCALLANGSVMTWGANTHWQHGDGTQRTSAVPGLATVFPAGRPSASPSATLAQTHSHSQVLVGGVVGGAGAAVVLVAAVVVLMRHRRGLPWLAGQAPRRCRISPHCTHSTVSNATIAQPQFQQPRPPGSSTPTKVGHLLSERGGGGSNSGSPQAAGAVVVTTGSVATTPSPAKDSTANDEVTLLTVTPSHVIAQTGLEHEDDLDVTVL